jgi:prolipoprotein diacylglyceryltransferase
LQASVPIGRFFGRQGYYFNGDVIVELKGVQSLDGPRFSRITINGEQVPTDFLNWKYRFRQLREYLAEQGNAYDIGTIEIRDGKVILHSRTN